MINSLANIIGQSGSLWSQQQQPQIQYSQHQAYNPYYQQQAYQSSLHGLSPAQVGVGEPLRWMFDGKFMTTHEFADAMFQYSAHLASVTATLVTHAVMTQDQIAELVSTIEEMESMGNLD